MDGSSGARVVRRAKEERPTPAWTDEYLRELGMGCPPEAYGSCAYDQMMSECSPGQSKLVVSESGSWTVDTPISDGAMSTFGDEFSPLSTPDGQPPPGVISAFNTLNVPNQFPSDMILLGLTVRILVVAEGRLIRTNYFNPGASLNIPGSPDVFTENDVVNNALGLAAGQGTPVPGVLAYGLSTWKVAYNLMNAYELDWQKEHQNSLVRQPLTTIATIQPFAEAEGAGLSFASNADIINGFNNRNTSTANGAPGLPSIALPNTHKRVGSVTVAGNNVSVFTPSREEDGSPTMFGAIGIPNNAYQRDPYLFATPMFWPASHSFKLSFRVRDPVYQAEMQRWLSATGGVGGLPGNDQSLAISTAFQPGTGLAPGTTGPNIMLEQTLDAVPVLITQQVQTMRAILKFGRILIELSFIGRRVPEVWKRHVAKALKNNKFQSPAGYGSLTALVSAA